MEKNETGISLVASRLRIGIVTAEAHVTAELPHDMIVAKKKKKKNETERLLYRAGLK